MKILDKTQIKLLDTLCDMEAKGINEMYAVSKRHGDISFKIAYNSFEEYLVARDGKFIHSMHTEWRYFLVQVLKNIEEKNLEHVYRILFFNEEVKEESPKRCENCKHFKAYEPKETLMGVMGYMGTCMVDINTKFEVSGFNSCSNNFEYIADEAKGKESVLK